MSRLNAGGAERFVMAAWLRALVIVAAVVMMIGIVTIPFSLFVIWRCLRAEAVLGPEGVSVSWLGLRGWSVRWSEIAHVRPRNVRSGLARMLQPLEIRTAAGRTRVLPVGGFRDGDRMLQRMREQGVAGMLAGAEAEVRAAAV